MSNQLKTGTTTVGILTTGGIILAADQRATAGNLIANKHCPKVFSITPNMAVTMAGSVSDSQLIVKLIRAELKLRVLRTGRQPTVKEAANLLAGIVYRNVRSPSMMPGISHFLLGGKDNDGYHLYDIYPDGSITDTFDFVSSGSGSVFAYGVLENNYNKDINIEDGKILVSKAVNAALQRDSMSGGGLTLFTITESGVTEAVDKQVSVDVRL